MALTSRERLLKVLGKQEPDRVPVWMLFPRERLSYYVDVYRLPAYAEIAPFIYAESDWLDRRSIATPYLFTANAQFEQVVLYEGDTRVVHARLDTPLGPLEQEERHDLASSASWQTRYLLQDLSDLEKALAIPYEPPRPDLAEFREAAARLGDAGLMMLNLSTPIECVSEYAAPANFALWIATDLPALTRFMDVAFEREYRFVEEALRQGAGPVFFVTGTEFAAPPFTSPAIFRRLCTHYNAPLFELIHRYGGHVIVHHHGRAKAVLEEIVESGADGVHPVEEPPVGDMPVAEAKLTMAGRACIVGSVQYDDISRLPEEEFDALVRRQIADGAAGGGMILAPTAGPYETVISPRHARNLRRMVEIARESRYPLRGH